jgi:hypothetical protein
MSNLLWSAVAGVAFGLIAVAMMLPMSFSDKRTALLAAFVDRFAVGLVIGCVQVLGPGWAVGLGFGLLLSLPPTIVTKADVPILVVGGLGGLVIGGLLHGWGSAA